MARRPFVLPDAFGLIGGMALFFVFIFTGAYVHAGVALRDFLDDFPSALLWVFAAAVLPLLLRVLGVVRFASEKPVERLEPAEEEAPEPVAMPGPSSGRRSRSSAARTAPWSESPGARRPRRAS